ncbi:MAG: hypothetical protein H6Q05_4337, partial [Acidobacteria bacterium]|nr:hypothetical protein [Acidobacteriota bacterium]
GPLTIEILDTAGNAVNAYNSNAPATSGGTGGGAPTGDPDAAPLQGRGGRGGGPAARVTRSPGMNRFVWNVQHQSGLSSPPGQYQARIKVDTTTLTQPFNVLIDPRLAAEGLTAADLREQFEHNLRMRELVASASQTVARVREAQGKLRGAAGADAETAKRVEAVAAKLATEPVRYGKPGLQAHITYLAGMTSGVDQKIGRDAVERYGVLKKELEAIRAELDKLLGPGR